MRRLLLYADWRPDARMVRQLLGAPDSRTVQQMRDRLVGSPHDFPDSLLDVLIRELPSIITKLENPETAETARDLLQTAIYERYARDRQSAM